MSHNVLLLSRYEDKGASSRVRHYNYIPALERAGIRVTTAPFFSNDYLERFYRDQPNGPQDYLKCYWRRLTQLTKASKFDAIWLEKEALPWLPAALERPFFRGRPVIVDFDDPWYLRYATHDNALVRAILRHKLEAIAARATTVTTGSPLLTEWARASHATRVIELPSAVDLDQYPTTPIPAGPFTIGWIGTPRNEVYLQIIAEPLRHLCATYGARLRVISGTQPFSLPGVTVDHVTWREDNEAAELAHCHVGIMPLVDEPWERGKCGYKLIQYMAAGRPAVASPVGANTSIIVPGQTGFLASGTQDWITSLSELAANRERVHTFGLAARQRAEALYSVRFNAPRVVQILKDAIASGGARRH